MKNKKVNLSKLKVSSFVTSFEGKEPLTVKGGFQKITNENYCNTAGGLCGVSFRCSGIGCD